ncbi:MAG: glycosyltransferase [Dermatophilaceae bacterium]
MRVLIIGINFYPEPTGVAPYTTALAEALFRAGHSTRVITGVPHYPSWRNVTDFRGLRRAESVRGIRVVRRRHYIANGGRGFSRLAMELSFGVSAVLERWHRPEVVLCVSPALFASALVMIRAKLSPSRPAVALWVQDLYGPGASELGASAGRVAATVGFVEGFIMKRADSVSIIHERFRRYVVAHRNVPPGKVVVNRNWQRIRGTSISDRRIREFRCQMGWMQNEIVALHSGNMGAKQGLETIVDAAKVAALRGSAVKFVLMGDGSQRRSLQNRAGDCGNLEFVSPVSEEDYETALAGSDILIICERSGLRETSVPSKLTSYLGAGKPIVAAIDPDGATADEVRQSGGGVLVPTRSPAQLLETVELIASSERAALLGEAGLRYAQASLSESSSVQRMVQWLENLHASKEAS